MRLHLRRPALFFVLFLLAALFLPVPPLFGSERAPSWVWNICVVPPEGGFDAEPGKSILGLLSWHEAEISESGSGVGGHDLHIVQAPILTSKNALSAALPINDRTAAVLSFASPEVDKLLVERLAPLNIPLLLAGGEDTRIDRNGKTLPSVFALDLFRDYRAKAFSAFAAQTVSPVEPVALMASRFTLNQEREAKICYGFLAESGFIPMPFWVDASVSDTFKLISEEIQSACSGVLIAFVGDMAGKELWRSFRYAGSSWRLWQCSRPDDSFLSFRGMLFADQNLFLEEKGGFIEIKRRLWNTRAIPISETVAAGRAEALVHWLAQAINSLPILEKLDRPAVIKALENVPFISFGNQRLELSKELHRPRYRQVYIAEVSDGSYRLVETLLTPGLPYVEYY